MKLFKGLFAKKKPELPPADLSVLKTDVHSHLIPGIDDGSASIEQSMEMLNGFHELGFSKVITTPHVMGDFYRNTPDTILKGRDDVREAIEKAGMNMEFEAAAEYYTDSEFSDLVKQKELLTFGDNYVLFELPFISEPPNLKQVVFDMQMGGFKPVLAHPERYSYYYRDFEKYQEIKDRGVLLQLNTNSLTGHYSPETKKIAERLIEEGMIDMIGSDCHNMNHMNLLRHARKQESLHRILESDQLLNKSL